MARALHEAKQSDDSCQSVGDLNLSDPPAVCHLLSRCLLPLLLLPLRLLLAALLPTRRMTPT